MSSAQDPIVALNNCKFAVCGTGCYTQLEGLDKWARTQPRMEVVSGKEYGAGTGTHKHLARGAAATLALEALKEEAESEQGDKLD